MASSAFDLEGRRWRRNRDAWTVSLKVYTEIMTDDSATGQGNVYGDDASWTDAMELISSRGRLDIFEQILQNPLYTDDEDNNVIELDEKTSERVNPKKPVSTSLFWIFQQH